MNKAATGFASTGTTNDGKPAQGYSVLNAGNPLGGLLGGIKVFPWLYNMMPGSRPGASKDEQERAKLQAAMLMLIGGSAVTGAAITGIGRGLKALYDARTHKDNPAADIGAETSTTYDLAGMGKDASVDKRAWEIDFPDKASPETLFSVAAPVGAFILASAATSGLIDSLSTSAREMRIDSKLRDRRKLYNDLLAARARNARGTLPEEEFASLQSRASQAIPSTVKSASAKTAKWENPYTTIQNWLAEAGDSLGSSVDTGARGIVAALGLIAAGVAGAAGVASYVHTKASDPDNIKYKAIEKGLQEYAKGKSSTTPITLLSPGSGFFSSLDQGAQPKTVRDLPQVTTDDLNKPISMTL